MSAGLMALVALLTLQDPGDPVKVAPDESLTSAEYVDLGAPAPDRSWSSVDLKTVGTLVKALAVTAARPTRLVVR